MLPGKILNSKLSHMHPSVRGVCVGLKTQSKKWLYEFLLWWKKHKGHSTANYSRSFESDTVITHNFNSPIMLMRCHSSAIQGKGWKNTKCLLVSVAFRAFRFRGVSSGNLKSVKVCIRKRARWMNMSIIILMSSLL